MRRTDKQKKSRKKWSHRYLAVAVMVAAIAALLSQTVFAQNSYVITDGDNVTVHKSYSTDPDVVLNEVGIELSEEDTYTTTYSDGVGCIDIKRMQMVTVVNRGQKKVIGTYGETVSSLLKRAGIYLGEDDVLSCKGESQTYDGLVVEIVHKRVEVLEYEETTPCPVNYYEDPNLSPGEEIVLVDGADGIVQYTAEVVYENSVEVSRTVKTETVVKDAVTRLVVKGPDRSIKDQPAEGSASQESSSPTTPGSNSGSNSSKPKPTEPTEPSTTPTTPPTTEAPRQDSAPTASGGVLTTSSGTSYEYVQVLNVSCTAYSCEGYTGYTYSGTLARVGAVAVDPNYIPLGTRMYIVSNDGQYIYGYCVAEDIGGGIKGNKVDLYFDTEAECIQFGVRSCTAYILR